MTNPFENASPAGRLPLFRAVPSKISARPGKAALRLCAVALLFAVIFANCRAQATQQTGPQQLSFARLLASSNPGQTQAQINALAIDAQGNLYLLLDQKDGVRLLKTDASANTVLAQTQIGAAGDFGLAMALDPAGNIYITGSTTSGALIPTPGAAFITTAGATPDSFIAKFDPGLATTFITFTGGAQIAASSIAATSNAVFITGTIFSASLPATSGAVMQSPAYGSAWNGFVEKFSSDGHSLLYATYLTGANGSTTSSAIAADSAGNAYIVGSTTSPNYPTSSALVPEMLGTTSGFLTKLTPAGDAIPFSTFIPGAGITSLAIDPAANNLILSGIVSLGQFPVASVQSPLANTTYQTLLRIPLDDSTVLASTVLAPASQSILAPGPTGTTWVAGSLSLPLLPLQPLSSIGNSFAVRVNSSGLIDQTARFGGIAASNPLNADAPVTLYSLAVDPTGNLLAAGTFAPYTSQSLLPTQTYDLPLTSPTPAFPSSVRAAVPSICSGSLCSGSAAYLAELTTSATSTTASLTLSTDDSPNLTLRNLASTEAANLQIAVAGFTFSTDCGSTLPAGEACVIALNGSGPGSITTSAANAPTQTQNLPAPTHPALPIAFTPDEVDFGIVSSASGTTTRTITVINLTQQSQTFTSAADIGLHPSLPYTFAETATDCAVAGPTTRLLAAGASCHITIGLTPSNSSADDGPILQHWLLGTRDVTITAYAQAAALSLSSPEIDFGTQYPTGIRLPRYLYLSNSSNTSIPHTAVTLPPTSPFSVIDRCPSVLEPSTICQLQFSYQSSSIPSTDSVTLSLDQGLVALVSGKTLPPPSILGAPTNPNLSLSATSLTFATPVPVTSVSAATQTLTLTNTGTTPFPLSIALTGDFTDTTTCSGTLPAGASCTATISFAPSQPGPRQGLLAINTGSNSVPSYVTLSGTASQILSPADNGTLDFGGVLLGQPSVQWYKVTQPFASFSAAATLGTPFGLILVEDFGFGHGLPPVASFNSTASGPCLNCWLGVQFTPSAVGLTTSTLTLKSSGSPYTLSLSGSGLPLAGLLITPALQDFGPSPIRSTSATQLFTITNLIPGATQATLAPSVVAGDFTLSNSPSSGTPCGGPLAYTASCSVEITFSPTSSGPRTGTLTLQAGSGSAFAVLNGYGSPDPGISLNPTSLTFNNVPGSTSTQQTIIVTNTSTASEQIGTPQASTTGSSFQNFTASSTCATLLPAASCTILVSYLPTTAPAAGAVNIPVTADPGGAPTTISATVPVIGAYTAGIAGLSIFPADLQFGPQPVGAPSIPRQITITNLTAKAAALSVQLPRQFTLAGPPCTDLTPNASCTVAIAFLPLTNGDITGTITAQAMPSDGTAALTALAYLEGYGQGNRSLTITSASLAGNILNFNQVPSGQAAQSTLTLTNSSTNAPLTVRRITSQWPFLSTTTCGATLDPASACTVTVSYTPINQATASGNAPVSTIDRGTLVIESDSASAPDLINLTGSSTPVITSSPSNTAPSPALLLTPGSLTFPATSGGSVSPPQSATLTNTGNATLNISSIRTTPDFVVTGNCPTLLAGATCPVNVTFAPQISSQPGAISHISAIEITSNATNPLEFLSLAGQSGSSSVAVTPTLLDFGNVLLATKSSLSVLLNNTGSAPATIASIATTGDYSQTYGTCPAPPSTLPGGASCTAQVIFAPSKIGQRTGTLSIMSPSAFAPLQVALTGVGALSNLQLSPASLSFPTTSIGASSTLPLTLSNPGNAPINSISFATTGDYAISQPCTLTTLAPGTICTLAITFTPTAAGTRSGALNILSSDPDSPAVVPLTGSTSLTAFFTLTSAGSSSASTTVSSGASATYNLTLTPLNGFTGAITFGCTPILPAPSATCAAAPSSTTLSSSAQSIVVTISTQSTTALISPLTRNFTGALLCLLFPGSLLIFDPRRRLRARQASLPALCIILSCLILGSAVGCGGNIILPSGQRSTLAGTYQYQVTATSSTGAAPAQSVTLNLTVK